MNVPTIKLICWLAALSSAGGLVKYVYDWFDQGGGRQSLVEAEYITDVLTEKIEVKARVMEIVDYEELKATFKDMSWTGEPPPKPVSTPTGPVDEAPKHVPISEVLAVIMVQYDTDGPGGSRASVRYRQDKQYASLRVGQFLKPPFDNAVVRRIQPEGVEFAFTDEERNSEVLELAALPSIPFGEAWQPEGGDFPKPKPGRERPAQTEQVTRGIFELGHEDVNEFATDYQRILSQDITTATYMVDGKRAGVEIKSVKAGSIATRHGVVEGDVLISINGHKVTSESEAISYVKQHSDTQTVWEVMILRFGEEQTIVYHSDDQ